MSSHPLTPGEWEIADAEGWYPSLTWSCIKSNPRGRHWPVLFKDSEEARAFVAKRADEGSEMHARIWAWHVKNRLTGDIK